MIDKLRIDIIFHNIFEIFREIYSMEVFKFKQYVVIDIHKASRQ